MANEFLYREYEECFKQMRYYDDRQLSLLKFSIILSSSIITAILAIDKIFPWNSSHFSLILVFLALVVTLGNMLILFSMAVNRMYFVYPVRQINAIRKYLMTEENPNFLPQNQMYLATDVSALKLFSIHSLIMLTVAMLSAIFFSLFMFSLLRLYEVKPLNLTLNIAGITGIIFLAIEIVALSVYFVSKAHKNCDQAIHNK
ncbi:MAG TPA: hypothetical protein DEE98_04595 [Elusimicrobia bacterium]|nr:MAG: hypothetical protein A2278_04280 [Elusimicrobia bacterium RIFOXYA12_FULL_49_49]OGS10508.1 MAG: hypothetical protein A2386_05390 [Elusimicrobia bacterium RIFOXYB1_FULL_48_9]OGS14731.1 MAG: hypothetical protein A2251_09560 [Elusimicrobia bacterium RIFOXYA2_FULL_47_53]OGS25617.1 MAG: hypothetical protein A2339_06030 [Elusimicrobia bacterium RIFOXYB12_FULL_50_12]OGS31822.1 MAG: hypothetical protein A2323_06470 [Elusimicrobia bacterium RIFOXYB2_FULL_46_23]HBU69644.1 hypothetical protein [El